MVFMSSSTTLIISNMVCDRCKAAVQRILQTQELPVVRVELGEVEVKGRIDDGPMQRLRDELEKEGFGLVLDRDAQRIARAKAAIVEAVHHGDGERPDLAALIQASTHQEFTTISRLFSEVVGITLEQYYLLQRVERVKELIRYGELTFAEIAFATGFSSAAHLSAQFKKLTGMTPTAFRKGHGRRAPLDQVG